MGKSSNVMTCFCETLTLEHAKPHERRRHKSHTDQTVLLVERALADGKLKHPHTSYQ